MLDVNKSKFVDFQKARIQETQVELPRGCIPRRFAKLILYWLLCLVGGCSKFEFIFCFSVEVILRAEAVELAQAGDRCDFIGTLIVVPDISSLSMSGNVLS